MPDELTNRHESEAANELSRQPQWQPLHLMTEDEGFEAYLQQTMPREAAVLRETGLNRRSFLKIMGASLALAGAGLAGCSPRTHDEPIIPYVRLPEEIVPGKPLFFASSMILGGLATGILIETHAGRPTRVEGNPQHPASLGGSSALVQASVLELYNPVRPVDILQNGERRSWDDFLTELRLVLQNRTTSGLRVLTETVTSPTLAAQLTALMEQFPGARWHQYEPVSRDNVTAGAQQAFGEVVNTYYDFAAANVVVSLDADFLASMPGSLRYARDFVGRRKVNAGENTAMNRLYMVETTPTITGAMADHRLALRPSQVEAFARALANALGIDGGAVAAEVPWTETWLSAVVTNLQANAGTSIVVAGPEQSPVVHALAHAINAALNNVGTTVFYTAPLEANPVIQKDDFAELVTAMQAREVETLIIIGGDPVLTAPSDLGFAEALAQVSFSAHLSYYRNDTSQLAQWFLPQTHYIEEWSDARAYDGALSIVQPPIGALYETVHSAHELLAAVLGDARSGYEIVRETWQSLYTGADFEAYWRRTLHDGVAPESALPALQPTLNATFPEGETAFSGQGLEINFRPDPYVWDGRFAHNSWLQELPRPITKITWDAAALLSPATAERLGLTNENLLDLNYRGKTMQAPLWIVRGHPDETLTISLGFGRGLSADVEAGYSFNAYAIRTADAPWSGDGLEVRGSGADYDLATIRSNMGDDTYEAVRYAPMSVFLDNPDFVHEEENKYTAYPEYPYDGNAWGMSIDLTSCIGCNACIIGCQTENNIPTVGKVAVTKGREMHWLRVDRYYVQEGPEDELRTFFQPVPCMHCETAPCEPVCPVTATVHDSEGLNNMVYNRCVGTRYCSANCPYSVRRFNYMKYVDEAAISEEWRNPNVTVRVEGVMEKCSYCVQRINAARITANNENRPIRDGEVTPACAAACPTQAISFGNLNDPEAKVVALKAQPHNYSLLGELNTKPRTTYLAKIFNPDEALFTSGSEEE